MNNLEEFRAQERARAAAEGTTIEEKMDELEAFTHSKPYADAMRELLGVKLKDGENNV